MKNFLCCLFKRDDQTKRIEKLEKDVEDIIEVVTLLFNELKTRREFQKKDMVLVPRGTLKFIYSKLKKRQELTKKVLNTT